MKFPRRGAVTFVFDDGYEAILKNVVPILDRYNMLGVFAVAIDGEKITASEKRNVAPWTEWVKIKGRGHEIASHTVSHSSLAKLTTENLTKELSKSRAALEASTIIYPGGAYNENVISEAIKYYSAGRTVERGFETLPPSNSMRLKTFNFTKRNFSLFKVNLFALWAWFTNSWFIETYHLVGDSDSTIVHNVPLADFEAHVRFLSRLPIKVSTIHNVINDL